MPTNLRNRCKRRDFQCKPPDLSSAKGFSSVLSAPKKSSIRRTNALCELYRWLVQAAILLSPTMHPIKCCARTSPWNKEQVKDLMKGRQENSTSKSCAMRS